MKFLDNYNDDSTYVNMSAVHKTVTEVINKLGNVMTFRFFFRL